MSDNQLYEHLVPAFTASDVSLRECVDAILADVDEQWLVNIMPDVVNSKAKFFDPGDGISAGWLLHYVAQAWGTNLLINPDTKILTFYPIDYTPNTEVVFEAIKKMHETDTDET